MCPSSVKGRTDLSSATADTLDEVTSSSSRSNSAVRLTAHRRGRDAAEVRARGRVVAGRYHLRELLGSGAMGTVWRAHDRTLRVTVAVKLLSTPIGAQAAEISERFRFEAQVAARLGRETRHIVAVHDVGEDEIEGLYLAMEYVPGLTLQEDLSISGPMEPARLALLLEQIGEALALAHRSGIVHRDIKPSNVLLAAGPRGSPCAKLADFGIAKGFDRHLRVDFPRETALGLVLGTPPYMSPEQACDDRTDAQADLWALAVVAYEALTGQKPFPGRSAGEVLASVLKGRPPLSTMRRDLPPALESWFGRAFALPTAGRFSSAEEMVSAYRVAIGRPVR